MSARPAPHRTLLARGQPADAETELLGALRGDPESIELHLDAVRLYHQLNEPERAALHLGRAREFVSNTPDPAEHHSALRLAEAIDHAGHADFASAAAAVGELVAGSGADTDDPFLRLEATTVAAECELELGSAFRAFKLAERVAKADSAGDHPALAVRAAIVLGRYHAGKGQADRAEKSARQASQLAADNGLAELEAHADGFLADLLHARALEGEADLDREAQSRHEAAAARLRALAASLPPERSRHWLAQGQRRIRLAPFGTLSGPRTPGSARTPSLGLPSADELAASHGDGSTDAGGESRSHSRLLATLSEMSLLVSSMTDLGELLERVMDLSLEIVGAERGLVVMAEPGATEADEPVLNVTVARNLDGETIIGVQEFSKNVIREALQGREVVTIDTANDDWMSQQKSVSLYSIRSLVCFPLKMSDTILGAVYLDNQKQVKIYSAEDLAFLRAFTNLAAIAIDRARLLDRLQAENVQLKKVATERFGSTNIIGTAPAMDPVFRLVEKAIDSAFPVLITGATGTGKEVFTKAIHFGSGRKDKPFVAQNCAAIPSELLESEMFGYKRGAFTGASQDKKGLFESANHGTLFLDEIGELDLNLQAKLLRVLQDGVIRRVGDTSERQVDVRIVSATNRNLKELVESQLFRLDLYYRLNVIQIDLPPLRDRLEDLPLLAQHFLEKSCKQMGKRIEGFSRRAIDRLRGHEWPGNVRELENVIARAVVFAEGTVIDLDSLPPLTPEPSSPAQASADAAPQRSVAHELFSQLGTGQGDFWDLVKAPFLKRDLDRSVVREVLREALEQSGWKYTKALKTLGLPDQDYRKFMNFLAKFDLKVDRPPSD